ncbi:hypothetical protein BUALT_Bualt04G0050200 [Buddleja alternifolia]|uniref:VQ domain-containing protein n=1 Tax=Buddleja alternifolia TaxID=168488 RepID=A0AAV6XLG1_9LAMI|nr:hypothetical protein BUALT_Bualt04G0050200 [Buddleja alternifolia]
MNFPELFSGGGGGDGRPSPRKELQGPRPTALKVNKDSYKIRKPPVAPPPHQHHPPQPEAPPPHPSEERQPVIIYSVSPKVIHTTVSDFMNLVQRLTGNTTTTTSSSTGGGGDVSPAARLASIEKTSPCKKDREIMGFNNYYDDNNSHNDDMMGVLLEESDQVEVGRVPGILSPAPASLPPISPGFFSPAVDPLMMMGYNNYYNNNNMFIPSPSTLFSAPMVSPSSSSSDLLFNPFFDF